MRGVGGPLLCIGDLLSDIGEGDSVDHHQQETPSSSSSIDNLQPSDLTGLFQETYDQLNNALAGTGHSWTVLTLKLCTALETADKLVESTNSNVGLLSEKLKELEGIVKRADSSVAEAKAIHYTLNKSEAP